MLSVHKAQLFLIVAAGSAGFVAAEFFPGLGEPCNKNGRQECSGDLKYKLTCEEIPEADRPEEFEAAQNVGYLRYLGDEAAAKCQDNTYCHIPEDQDTPATCEAGSLPVGFNEPPRDWSCKNSKEWQRCDSDPDQDGTSPHYWKCTGHYGAGDQWTEVESCSGNQKCYSVAPVEDEDGDMTSAAIECR